MTRSRLAVCVAVTLLVVATAFAQFANQASRSTAGDHRAQGIFGELVSERSTLDLELAASRQAQSAEASIDSGVTQADGLILTAEGVRYIEGVLGILEQLEEAARVSAGREFIAAAYVQAGWHAYGEVLTCIRRNESNGRYNAVNASSRAAGAFQFLPSTWDSTARVSGRTELVGVFPADAAPQDQDFLAIQLYERQGHRPWVGARGCV